MRNAALWRRLQAHAFDAPRGTQPYSVKLALAEGWDATYTADVVEEYRKFIYLTQVTDGQVTPSIAVDRAWHMHLTFTRDYWERLCPEVLGRPLHHEPCAGEEEMPRYHRQFDETRELYEAEFGMPPPAHVWGSDDAQKGVRAKAPKRLTQIGLCSVSAGVALLFLEQSVAIALIVFTVIGAIAWDAWRGQRRRKRKNHGGHGTPGGCGGCGSGGRGNSKGEGSGSDNGGDGGSGGCGGGGCGG